jgi:heterodisulfide reductase subunit A
MPDEQGAGGKAQGAGDGGKTGSPLTAHGSPKIGVFICHCGSNIGGIVDVPAVVEYASKLKDVVHAERNLYTCADDGLTAIKTAIAKHGLNRVLVASCTPRTHAPLFRRTCEAAGLNQYLFEFVNLREHCSWVHMKEPARATGKAKALVKMGVARARLLERQEEPVLDIAPSAMVLGGGVAGMSAALSIANQGFSVHLVEREKELGGMAARLHRISPTYRNARDVVGPAAKAVKEHPDIRLHMPATMTDLSGYIGNFDVTLSTGERFRVGSIVVATGADELRPEGLYGWGKLKDVLTQMELEKLMEDGKGPRPKSVVMIQCAGSRGQRVTYCSKRCCFTAIKNAILLREESPGTDVHILHNEVHVYGVAFEKEYRRAQELGVKFSRYSPEKPSVSEKDGRLNVNFYDEGLRRERDLPADLVVLSTPLVARPEAEDLSKLLKVPLGQDRFFFEAHVKLRPVDFATDGIFICGTAKGPTNIGECVEQALGAASRAAIPLAKGRVKVEAITSKVDTLTCRACGRCESECDYHAISIVPIKDELGERLVARINEGLCKGCGKCASICCNRSISLRHFTTPQLMAMVEAALEEG